MHKLFFKELRVNRMLPACFALLLCLLMAALKVLNLTTAQGTPPLLFGTWLFAAIFAGSGLISREVGSGSLQFLMALPVGRSHVWLTKAAAGLVLTLLCMVSTLAAWGIAQFVLYGNDAFIYSDALANAGWLSLITLGCYCLSLAISTLLDRAISAAMVGILAMAALLIPLVYGTNVYSFVLFPRFHITENVAVAALALSPGLLLASYWSFLRGESLRTNRRFSFAILGCSLGLILGWTILLATGMFLGRFHRFGNQNTSAALSPDGRWVVVSALDGRLNEDSKQQVYDPQEYRARHLVVERTPSQVRVPGPLVWSGSKALDWSPDGRYLVYVNSVGPFGLNLYETQLMVGDVQSGAASWVPWVARSWDSGATYDVKWSPDSQWLAIDDPTQGDVQFIARADIAFGHSEITRRRVASRMVPFANYETAAEQRSRRFSLYHSGCPPQQELHFHARYGGGWSSDSRYFYTLRTSVLVAIDPLKAPVTWGEPTNPAVTTGVYPKGVYPLCTIPPYGNLEMETSADRHRTLVTLLVGSDTVVNDGPGKQSRSWKSQTQSIVDLPAATEAALQRDRDELPPAVETWLRQWTSHSVPASCAHGSLSISPDGRFLALRQHDTLDPPGRRARDVSSTTLLSVDGNTTHLASPGVTAGVRRWLPDDHRYSITDGSNVLWTTDAATGESQSYPLGDGQLLGISAGEHLLLSPPTINDAFNPIEATISISAGHSGEK